LSEQNIQQVIALGRLGWSLRRIQRATGVRRETAAAYLRAAGIAFRPPGKWGRASAKPANEVIADLESAKSAGPIGPDPPFAKPANEAITDFGAKLEGPTAPSPMAPPGRSPSSSACEPYRETIEVGFSRGRNAMAIWQDLVDPCGFSAGYQSVQRFVRKLRPSRSPDARVVIETAAGEECQVDYGDGPMVRNAATGKYRRTRLFVIANIHPRQISRIVFDQEWLLQPPRPWTQDVVPVANLMKMNAIWGSGSNSAIFYSKQNWPHDFNGLALNAAVSVSEEIFMCPH